MASIALIGFGQSAGGLQSRDLTDLTLHQWDSDPIGTAPGVLALLLEADDGAHQSANYRRIDVMETIRRGGTVVAVLGINGARDLAMAFGTWLCSKYEFETHASGVWDMRSASPGLEAWFRRHVAHVALTVRGDVDVIARVTDLRGASGSPASFMRRVDGGRLVVTQLRDSRAAATEIIDFISRLPPVGEYPSYLDDLSVDEEVDLAAELARAQREVERLEQEIGRRRNLKRIMYLAGNELEIEVVHFLTDELQMPAEHVDGNKEDFWLISGDPAERWCIGEVKGKERANVSRADLSATDAHRDEAGLPPEYPALLVANTFAKANSLDQRDQPIHPDLVDRARADNIVVVRTLDLIRLRRLILRESSARTDFIDALEGPTGGWYEVNGDLIAVLK